MRRCPVMFEFALILGLLFLNISYLYLSIQFVKLHRDVKQCLAALDAFMTVIRSSGSADPEVNPDD